MPHPSWNESYASAVPPWDTGEPEALLVEFVTSGGIAPTRTLEIGACTGTDAIGLAERGFDVLGVDITPLAIEKARAKMEGRDLRCRFRTLDFLAESARDGPFQFVSMFSMNTSRESGSPRASRPHWHLAARG